MAPESAAVSDEEGVAELLAAQHVHQEVGRRVDARQEVGQTEKKGDILSKKYPVEFTL